MLILPANRWHAEGQLVDPTGAAYSPTSPPEIIKGDEVLFSALMYGYENRHRIGVTVLSSLQISAEDLGAPGEFEDYMAKADVYGSPTFAQPLHEETQGYSSRVEQAIANYGRPMLLPFATLDWRDSHISETMSNLRILGQATQSMFEGIDLNSLGVEFTGVGEVNADALVAKAHLMNHLNWVTVANLCDQVRQLGSADTVNVLLDEALGGGLGATRVLGGLGIRASLRELSLGNWPPDYYDHSIAIENTLATGRVEG